MKSIQSEVEQVNDDDLALKVSADLLTFELPPVSEKASGFIEADIEDIQPSGELGDDAQSPQPNKDAETYRGAPSANGGKYDPVVHVYPPEETPSGRWKRLPKSKQGEAGATITGNAGYRRAAQQYAMLYANAHVTIFGADGALDKLSLPPLVDALEAYLQENGLKELSPNWQVALSAVNYSTVIATRENNAAKVKRWFAPVTNYITNLFSRKKAEKEQADKIETAHQAATTAQPDAERDPDGFHVVK